jgi:hypothetical protein
MVLAGRILCAVTALVFLAILLRKLIPFLRPLPEWVTKYLVLLSATGAAFFGTFFLTSPWLFYRLDFVRQILARNSIVEAYKPFGLWNWLDQLLWTGWYVGYASAVLALAGLAWLVVAAARRDWQKINLAYIPVWGFGIIFVTLLVLKVNRATVLYGMPITPLLALLAAYFVWRLTPYLARLLRLNAVGVGAFLAAAVVLTAAAEGVPKVMTYRMLVTDITPDNRRLGNWLTACLPPETGILGASYSYVPPRFQNFVGGDGQLYFDRIHPSVVIVNHTVKSEVENGPQPPTDPTSIDRAKLFRLLDTWKTGPAFGLLQVYLRPDVKLSSACSG